MARLSFRCDDDLVRRVDAERGLIPREAWLRRAVEQALAGPPMTPETRASVGGRSSSPTPAEPPVDVEQALSEAKEPIRRKQADLGSVSSSEGVRSAAPAEQPSVVELEAECDRLASEYEERARSYRQHVPGPNVEGIRSSLAAKRDVRPISKKGER